MIRPATSDDAGDICDLWNWMIRDTLATFTTVEKTPDEVAQMINDRLGAFFVAHEEGRFRGFVSFGPFRPGPGYAATVEHSILVQSDARSTGIGRALMQHAEKAARDQGKRVMVGAISSANPDAMGFHEAIGFTVSGRLADAGRKNGQWLDLILMQKILSGDL